MELLCFMFHYDKKKSTKTSIEKKMPMSSELKILQSIELIYILRGGTWPMEKLKS